MACADLDLLNQSVEQWHEYCIGCFPEGTRAILLITAHTIAPGESTLDRILSRGQILQWSVSCSLTRFNKRKVSISLALGECCFWSGPPDELPEKIL